MSQQVVNHLVILQQVMNRLVILQEVMSQQVRTGPPGWCILPPPSTRVLSPPLLPTGHQEGWEDGTPGCTTPC